MKMRWFREWGLIYYPVSWQGFLLTLLVLAFCVQIFIAVDGHSHSVSDTLYGVFPYIVPSILVLFFIASKTCQGNSTQP